MYSLKEQIIKKRTKKKNYYIIKLSFQTSYFSVKHKMGILKDLFSFIPLNDNSYHICQACAI